MYDRIDDPICKNIKEIFSIRLTFETPAIVNLLLHYRHERRVPFNMKIFSLKMKYLYSPRLTSLERGCE